MKEPRFGIESCMLATTALFAKSVIMEFFRGPWGLPAFLAIILTVMVLGFYWMKYLDDSKSYSETYHNPPRG